MNPGGHETIITIGTIGIGVGGIITPHHRPATSRRMFTGGMTVGTTMGVANPGQARAGNRLTAAPPSLGSAPQPARAAEAWPRQFRLKTFSTLGLSKRNRKMTPG